MVEARQTSALWETWLRSASSVTQQPPCHSRNPNTECPILSYLEQTDFMTAMRRSARQDLHQHVEAFVLLPGCLYELGRYDKAVCVRKVPTAYVSQKERVRLMMDSLSIDKFRRSTLRDFNSFNVLGPCCVGRFWAWPGAVRLRRRASVCQADFAAPNDLRRFLALKL